MFITCLHCCSEFLLHLKSRNKFTLLKEFVLSSKVASSSASLLGLCAGSTSALSSLFVSACFCFHLQISLLIHVVPLPNTPGWLSFCGESPGKKLMGRALSSSLSWVLWGTPVDSAPSDLYSLTFPRPSTSSALGCCHLPAFPTDPGCVVVFPQILWESLGGFLHS